MPTRKVFLKPNAVAQPLVHQWYAWSHLIAPAPAALNVVGRHLKIMKSYIQAPQIHAAAVKNPELAGGPFMDLPVERVGEVKELLRSTMDRQAGLIELAGALRSLETLLREEGKGFSLEPLYARVPPPLKGYVELLYDLEGRATFRLVEPLLYRSRFYDPGLQSVALSLATGDLRPFVMSTPILRSPEALQLDLPFRSPGLDALFRTRSAPRAYGELKEELGVPDAEDERFRRLFTEEPPPPPPAPYAGPGVRVRYFGHACLLFETAGTSILTDPLISYGGSQTPPRYTYADLPETIDYVLITHNHKDHFLLEPLLQLRHRIRHLVVPRPRGGAVQDPGLKVLLQTLGFSGVIELDELEALEVPGARITGIPFWGEHADLDIRTKLAYHLSAGGRAFLIAADSCNLEPALYEHLREAHGDVDVLFVSMECDGAPLSWLYGALLPAPLERDKDRSRRLSASDLRRGLELVDRLRCREVYVYAMGQEPWLKFLTATEYGEGSIPIATSNRFIEALRQQGVVAERWFAQREVTYS